MNFIALVSGGKDGVFAILECIRLGHTPICLANLCPPGELSNDKGDDEISNDLDSFMIQTVGHEVLPGLSYCLGLPIVRRCTRGLAKHSKLDYPNALQKFEFDQEDEVEDLFQLVYECKKRFPAVTAVCSGAVLSNYQRLRVEAVCKRLHLHPLAPLWGRSQRWLVRRMCSHENIEQHDDDDIEPLIDAVIVKVAAHGLTREMIGQRIHVLRSRLETLALTSGVGECGEGGEYESIALDGNYLLFSSFKLVLDKIEIISSGSGSYYSKIRAWHIERKNKRQEKVGDVDQITDFAPPGIPSLAELKDRVIWSTDRHHIEETQPTWRSNDTSFPEIQRLESFPSKSAVSPNIIVLSASSSMHRSKTPHDATLDCLEQAQNLLCEEGLSIADICNCHVYLQDMADFESVNAAFSLVFTQDQHPPSRSAIEVKSIRNGKTSPLVKIDFIALRGGSNASLNGHRSFRSTLFVSSRSGWAPQCIGPYCQANVIMSKIVLSAGQIGLDPSSMILVSNQKTLLKQEVQSEFNPVIECNVQCTQALKNISRVLASCSSSLPQALVLIVYVNSSGKSNVIPVTTATTAFQSCQSIRQTVLSWASGNLQKEAKDQSELDDEEEGTEDRIWKMDEDDFIKVEESGVDEYPLSDSAFDQPAYIHEMRKSKIAISSSASAFPVVMINVSNLPRNALVEVEGICVTDPEKILRRVLSVPSLESSNISSHIDRTECVCYFVSGIMSAVTITVVDKLSDLSLSTSSQETTGDVDFQLAAALAPSIAACLQFGAMKKATRLLRLFVATSTPFEALADLATNDGPDGQEENSERFVDLLSNFILKELSKDEQVSEHQTDWRHLLPAVTFANVPSIVFSSDINSKSSSLSFFSRGVTAVLTEFA